MDAGEFASKALDYDQRNVCTVMDRCHRFTVKITGTIVTQCGYTWSWPDEQPTTVLGGPVEVKYYHVVVDDKMTCNSLDRSA